MTIEKLEEFASNGDKHLTGLDVATGFPRADKPERPWFNKLFGDITGKINEVVDNIKGLESIADLSTINNPKDGLRVYVKSYHAGLKLGGGWFTYDSSKSSENNGGTVINGWIRELDNETITPEMFKNYAGDDWTVAITSMFKSCIDMPTGSGISSGVIYGKLQRTSNPKRVLLTKLYRHTKPIHIPPNVTIDQASNTGFFSKGAGLLGFFYDPVVGESDTYAVAPFLYKKDADGTYSHNTNVMELPTEAAIDSEYIQAGQRIQINKLSILTNQNVTLGFRAVGMAGSEVNNLNVGENDGASSRIPKVAVLTNSCWNTVFNHPTTLSSVQGWVNWGSNGGLTVNNPYVNNGYNAAGHETVVPIYKDPSFAETGSVGITNAGDCYWNQPITEHWVRHWVSSFYLRAYHPHIEGGSTVTGFHFIGGNGATGHITCKDLMWLDRTNPLSSLIYIQDSISEDAVLLDGRIRSQTRLIRGTGTPCVTLDIERSNLQLREGAIGDTKMIRAIKSKWEDDTIYVHPTLGSDDNFGLRADAPVETFDNALRLARLMGIAKIHLQAKTTTTGNYILPSKMTISGEELELVAGAYIRLVGVVDITLSNSKVSGLSDAAIFNAEPGVSGIINVASAVTGGYLVSFSSYAKLILELSNAAITPYAIALGNTTNPALVDIIVGSTYTPNRLVMGGARINSSNISAKKTHAPIALEANAVTSTTIALQGVEVGMNITCSYSKSLQGTRMWADATSKNTVTVYQHNPNPSPVTVSAGEIVVNLSGSYSNYS